MKSHCRLSLSFIGLKLRQRKDREEVGTICLIQISHEDDSKLDNFFYVLILCIGGESLVQIFQFFKLKTVNDSRED